MKHGKSRCFEPPSAGLSVRDAACQPEMVFNGLLLVDRLERLAMSLEDNRKHEHTTISCTKQDLVDAVQGFQVYVASRFDVADHKADSKLGLISCQMSSSLQNIASTFERFEQRLFNVQATLDQRVLVEAQNCDAGRG